MKDQPELKIYELPVADLVPYARNAKEHSASQVDTIAASIEEFGNCDPIAVWHNANGEPEIVEGHGRLLALKKLGHDVAPVITSITCLTSRGGLTRTSTTRQRSTLVSTLNCLTMISNSLISTGPASASTLWRMRAIALRKMARSDAARALRIASASLRSACLTRALANGSSGSTLCKGNPKRAADRLGEVFVPDITEEDNA